MASPTTLPPNMTGRFGRMFDGLSPTAYSEKNLSDLADALVTDDPKKDGEDGEESDFGSAYTYLGQFIDHDLTFDPSTFEMQKNDPSAIIDFRTPAFDLDNVYGRGPDDQPYLYDEDGIRFNLGNTPLTGASRNPKARDLLRVPATPGGVQRAVIGDPRNDENVIVSELQGMMYRFHNAIADKLAATFGGTTFAEVQREVRWHYQLVVLRDFLPKIVGEEVLSDVCPAVLDPDAPFANSPPRLKFYKFSEPVMPVEFSVAAYRLGHSMVRPGYRVHEEADGGDGVTFLLSIFDHDHPNEGLNAFNKFLPDRAIDWQRFIDLGIGPKPETSTDRVQMAYKIDTAMVNPLGNLPPSVAGDQGVDVRRMNLAFRNLLRGQLLLLPSGQDVARAMEIPESDILTGDQIFIGTADSGDPTTTPPTPPPDEMRDGVKNLKDDFGGAFNDACPLWVYILAEARHRFYTKGMNRQDARLTGVGGRIVAETFLALMSMDKGSVMHAPVTWKPISGTTSFTLADLLNKALTV